MKVLFLTQTTQIGPASRYRVYQYIDYLENNNIKCVISSGLPESCYKFFYHSLNPFKKILLLPIIFIRRFRDLLRVKNYDIIFIQREILPQCFPMFEIIISKLNKNIIFDFDDAIFLIPPQRKSFLYRFAYKQAIKQIIRLSAQIITGNDYLKKYAMQFNRQVEVIPTSVDMQKWSDKNKCFKDNKKIVIGWIGTRHNIFYLETLKDAFKKLSLKYDICLHVVGNSNLQIDGVEVVNIKWDINTEVEQVKKFDIGIAPSLDDDWAKGKCGLKALQYMACSVATVCSRVGVYKQIIDDGQNGYLACNDDDWIRKLSLLITDSTLRDNLGKAGRKTVESKYSVNVNKSKLKLLIEKLKQ